jgi:type II secretory pathway component PulJ
MPTSVAHHRSLRGATLIEVIAALGIGALVVAVIALAHFALTSETSRQNRQMQTVNQIDQTLFELREDLQQLFLPAGDPGCGIELEIPRPT